MGVTTIPWYGATILLTISACFCCLCRVISWGAFIYEVIFALPPLFTLLLGNIPNSPYGIFPHNMRTGGRIEKSPFIAWVGTNFFGDIQSRIVSLHDGTFVFASKPSGRIKMHKLHNCPTLFQSCIITPLWRGMVNVPLGEK